MTDEPDEADGPDLGEAYLECGECGHDTFMVVVRGFAGNPPKRYVCTVCGGNAVQRGADA